MPTIKTYIELEVEIEYHGEPYTPAKTCGPPEDCYPEEGGEVEIQEVVIKYQGVDTQVFPPEQDISGLLSDKQLEQLTEECQNDWNNKGRDSHWDSNPDYD